MNGLSYLWESTSYLVWFSSKATFDKRTVILLLVLFSIWASIGLYEIIVSKIKTKADKRQVDLHPEINSFIDLVLEVDIE